MKATRNNLKTLANDENADARVAAFFSISAILTVVLIVVWSLAPPPNIGVSEGQIAPDISSDAHTVGGSWEPFQLYDYFNHSWTEGEPGQYIFLQFMDTDCPHCWEDAKPMVDYYNEYGANGAVLFITVSVGMLNSEHSREETVAFQEATDFEGCYQDARNCQERVGGPHNWLYVDDLNKGAFNDYNPPGVPFHLLLSPDGTVVWNSAAHPKGDLLHEPSTAIEHHLSGDA